MRFDKVYKIIFILLLLGLVSGCLEADSVESDGSQSGDETYEWRMISTWTDGSIQFEHDKSFADTVNELSNGRLVIKLYGADQLAPANQVLDTVSAGTVEMGGDWANYWSGRNTAFDLLGSHALGFTNWDYFVWINDGGGLELYNEIYGNYNTVYFPHSVAGIESGVRSNTPIESLDDFKGLNIRVAGLIQTQLFEQLGAAPTTLAAHEIYESLDRGVIDATEFGTPIGDDLANLYEVTDYWFAPGWHQTSSVLGAIINKDAWESLPDDLKMIIEKASKVTMTLNTSDYVYRDAVSTNKMIDEHGIQTTQLSAEEFSILSNMTDEILGQLASDNPEFKKVLDSQYEYLEMYAPYRELQGEWGFGNNLKTE